MKSKFSRCVLALLLCIIAVPYAQADDTVKKNVAVYVTGNDIDNNIRKVLGAKLVTSITSGGEYAAVERTADFLEALSKENDYQTSGEVRDSQIAALGKKFGVKFVVVADVSEVFDELFVASRLINVVTGLVERAYDANGSVDTMAQLIKLSQDVASGLLKGANNGRNTSSSSGINNSNLNGHEYVDLGLPSGLKWATCNVGASSPSDYGYYFAWGETNTKSDYSSNTCRTWERTFGDISGNVQYDAARANWGGSWRLPTRAECEELVNCCTWAFITMGNHNGYKVIGPNGNFIFLPAAGYRNGASFYCVGENGYYWTSTPYGSNSQSAYELYFYSGAHRVDCSSRGSGRSVRPVSE